MLRLLHTSDIHLGARHTDLADRAAAQRERQFAAFRATVDLALEAQVDLFLVAGDLFDSNTQPRRSVEHVAAQLRRLAAANIRTVLTPGTHDVYDRASIYRAYDLASLAGLPPDSEFLSILTPERSDVTFEVLGAVVYGRVFGTKKAPHSPLDGFVAPSGDGSPPWRIGLLHAAISIPGKSEHDDVVITTEEIAASGLDYLALGHWHSTLVDSAGPTRYAYSGAPEPTAADQSGSGNVLLVELDDLDGRREVRVGERRVGRTRFDRIEIDAGTVVSQAALMERLMALSDPDLVLDVRLTGIRPDELDIDLAEVERASEGSFLKLRVRNHSLAALPEGPIAPPDTILGAFTRDLQARIHVAQGAAKLEEEAELRDALRLARLLLEGHEVTL